MSLSKKIVRHHDVFTSSDGSIDWIQTSDVREAVRALKEHPLLRKKTIPSLDALQAINEIFGKELV